MSNDENLYIDGAFVPSTGSARIGLTNPATEERFAQVADATGADVDAAVSAARRALPAWRETTAAERAGILVKIADGIAGRAGEMDALVMKENGATKQWAGYVASGGHFLYRGAAAMIANFQREEVRETSAGKSLWRNEPIGVVGAIVPWNSPQVLIASKVGPALAAGCTVVLKPSPETGLDGIMLAEIMHEAGVPKGVVNVVNGGRETGAALVANEGVDMVSFTGSTVAGRAIASVCGQQLKRVSAELGGKSAAVLMADVDLDVFKPTIFAEVLPYSGQVCYAHSRILVHRSRFDEVVQLFMGVLSASKVGDPTEADTMFGPLITAGARDKVEGYIKSALDEGARCILGGGRPAGLDKGFYVEPTIFVDVKPQMRIFQEEIFGPVIMIVPFDTDDEAVALANDSNYGLAGAVFGTDLERANYVARRMETGRVGINGARGASRFSSMYKASGIGTVGEMGPEGFLMPKNLLQPV